MSNSNNFFDAINLASLIIGLQNLQENREQSSHNDVQSANNKQAEYLLNEINARFQEQNVLLDKILKLLEELCKNAIVMKTVSNTEHITPNGAPPTQNL